MRLYSHLHIAQEHVGEITLPECGTVQWNCLAALWAWFGVENTGREAETFQIHGGNHFKPRRPTYVIVHVLEKGRVADLGDLVLVLLVISLQELLQCCAVLTAVKPGYATASTNHLSSS